MEWPQEVILIISVKIPRYTNGNYLNVAVSQANKYWCPGFVGVAHQSDISHLTLQYLVGWLVLSYSNVSGLISPSSHPENVECNIY